MAVPEHPKVEKRVQGKENKPAHTQVMRKGAEDPLGSFPAASLGKGKVKSRSLKG